MTPDATFSIHVTDLGVQISVVFPVSLHLTEAGATQLEGNLHNAIEMALSPYFVALPKGAVKRGPTPQFKF